MTGVIEVQKDTAKSLPVILIDSSDFQSRETGVGEGSVTCKYAKAGDSTLSTFTLTGKWDEIGEGLYEVDFGATEFDTLGLFYYVVYGTGYLPYYGCVDVVDKNSSDVEVLIEHPEQIVIPDGVGQIETEFTAGATSLELKDASLLPNSGFFIAESEWCYYGAKSVNTLTSIVRGLFGTSDATHAVGVVIYQGIPQQTILTIHDDGVPKAPNAVPTIEIEDMQGTTIVSPTAMTQEGSKVGIYYYNFLLGSNQAFPGAWILKYSVEVLSGKTNEYRKVSLLIGEPSSQSDITGNHIGTGIGNLRVATQDGYLDGSGVWHAWTDDYVGAFKDADGDFVFRGLVIWQHVVSGSPKRQVNPPASRLTDDQGEWAVYITPGTYMVHFWKDGIRDVEVQRIVT